MSAVTSPHASHDWPTTLGALRASGHRHRSVGSEVRQNLHARLRSGEERFPGVVGFDTTVLPQLERALLAGHDVLLVGRHGQGRSRLLRAVAALLDEWTPAVAGCAVNDHPYAPVCPACREAAAEAGEDLPVVWRHRTERYNEKLCTPDTSVGDLIGDIDPVRLADGYPLSDPRAVHYGLVPRTNRGVVGVNELPELAAQLQVALLDVLEEREAHVRGHTLRLPLDVLVLATANPENPTRRGRIVAPLRDRFGAHVRTHYPEDPDAEAALIRQEARVDDGPDVPDHLMEIAARFVRLVRESPSVDERCGVSTRLGTDAVETAAASAARRGALTGEEHPVARVCDLEPAVDTLRDRVEFEAGEEERGREILTHLLRRATLDTFRNLLGDAELGELTGVFTGGATVASGPLVSSATLLDRLGPVPELAELTSRVRTPAADGDGSAEHDRGHTAAAVEFALEGLYLNRQLSRDTAHDGVVYRL
ncbi:magnesium chelatase subunit I [Haloactinospora alba]|uniref:Magnesium chelatase subunit I n=1 Tax=Haloactinospora alba TaxID=405555 RepID=A0A543NM53_9ACTN|nr:sigma 54-interacting transcriptional regulator [Haloactinospora alba]TQN32899.1 magnesium chelatase subunit I [Haloactinospora alba]